ncbi:Clan MH, family M20, peptidase T-like metallopeptidase [Trichomonas vaginalis G3]|uniref:Clan MH, family M20, peptidase T-like metallopeptidase n=1 Tax=Trichomonas vaginalis (strain ATCC PRA-98 / G3) TaxID=412133 RepID=A2FMK8_TRIV3|nr:Clan MH, family M20, peptidase T-like metallopeptidase [Trichomonas vaginalis G3]EAX93846.1 Clan MH, family M20, peptidase T-like metallopeptidase [Trichomonas vaginalis G3]KAI5528428.1 Clan MH, family M20, peptidase T-like metallopeptidase [Trichomonas vaginalis G3]|eukprot:XP_001306776.1 Clan MH, family M20, peptidase T-like metallopeptidase [Trichomonas vaginalis G3]
MNAEECVKYCAQAWSEGGFALEGLKGIIRIPNLSPGYDEHYFENGLVYKALHYMADWIKAQNIKGCKITTFEEPKVEPLLFVEIDSTADHEVPAVLTYGHLDKMPHLDPAGWSEGLGATNPVVRGNKIYGRGTNDDCYEGFLVITAIKYLQEHNIPHPRIVMLMETGEESGDDEIMRYLPKLKPQIGEVGVIMVLDAEAEDYKTLWCCKSLRGVAMGVLEVQHLATPCHSGMATGLVPDTFRIARMLVSRIEDEQTGEIKLKEAHIDIPQSRIDMCNAIAKQLGAASVEIVAPIKGAQLLDTDYGQLLVNKAFKPGLAVTGQSGLPIISEGSNVIRTTTGLKLSLRLPPGADAETALAAMEKELTRDPPYGAKVTFKSLGAGNGWFGEDFDAKTAAALEGASQEVFGQKPLYYGEGGSIPLCNTLQSLWPKAQIIVTGAAGTDSNPHGFDESLNIEYTGKFAAVITGFLGEISK